MRELAQTIDVFLYPLGLLAVFGLLFFTERLIFLHKGRIQPKRFVRGIENLLKASRYEEALSVCEQTPCAVARLTRAALLHRSEPPLVLKDMLRQHALLELPMLRKRIESLHMMGQIAPLIGLIGTVFFLLKGFWRLGELQAYTYLTSVAPLFASALAVTLVGLSERLLFTIAYHFLNGRVRLLIFDLEWTASEWLLFFQKSTCVKKEEATVTSEG
ncbi:MAG: MotA/TolQ/ExbB proton channel family protein [Opitutales bacterium]|nr:MotA/TolQ/ExbB proton channel family protein [Opitutales bacterium]